MPLLVDIARENSSKRGCPARQKSRLVRAWWEHTGWAEAENGPVSG
jgi:hypothetical protein